MPHVTAVSLKDRKQAGERIAVLTAYDYPTARIMDEVGVDVILVGDSVATAVMGRPDTLSVTVDEMLHHVRMVSRAVNRALVVADMPFLSYQVTPQEALRNAGRFISEGGAQAVKLEGPAYLFGDAIQAILSAGIPVMGHLGFTPQSLHRIGGYKVQGRDREARERLKMEARGLENAGCFAIVLEMIPADLGAEISSMLSIPTIGIGAGAGCDGQVLVMHDMLGMGLKTHFVKVFADVRGQMESAFKSYVEEVKGRSFPGKEHEFE
jgi:3-methyl-2-oxobutanoate hydroxymethyltransferase